MGMDVFGKREDTYFRNNVWWWRPLWAYVGDVCDLSEKDYQMGANNNGWFYSKKKANKIATTLFKEVKSKRTHDYMLSRNEHLESLPLKDCEHCNGTGTRTDIIDKENGCDMSNRETSYSHDCNACNSGYSREEGLPLGKVEDWETHYSFDVDNVRTFAKFCKESDGFEIC